MPSPMLHDRTLGGLQPRRRGSPQGRQAVTGGRLSGKTAIVTGSTKGIGLGIARAYVREGARVVVNSRSVEDCARVARELGPSAVAVAPDLSRSDEVRRLARKSLAALGGTVDILVNNAGQPRVAPSESLAE